MDKINIEDEINSEEYKIEWERLVEMRNSIVYCLKFCYLDSVRDGISEERNFFLRMTDDILQSIVSLETLAKEGFVNTCRRELRYLIELSIKSCVIVNNSKSPKFVDQIKEYEKLLNSSNINPINILSFWYLKTEQEKFKTEVKMLYGYLSRYSHSSSFQILEKLNRVETGRPMGYEGINELKDLNDDIEKVFLTVIILIFHSVAQYVVGDFMVEENGETIKWYFNKSKFINIVDENFDYKCERQNILEQLKQDRLERITF
jgi:hypothetical protein